jgi:transposase
MLCRGVWSRGLRPYWCLRARRLAARRGKKRAIIAVAHTIIVIGYHLQKNQSNYEDLGGNYFDRIHSDGLKRYLVKRLQQLGHKVTLEPMEAA